MKLNNAGCAGLRFSVVLSIALAGAGVSPLWAQIKTTFQPDGVVKYESLTLSSQPPSFWQVFYGLFGLAPNKRPFERSVALLVGVSSYSYLSPQLTYVKTDLVKLKDALMSEEGFDVVYVAEDAIVTADLVEDYMVNRLPRELGENDRLIFYYSGHGADIGGTVGYMQFSKARSDIYSASQYLPITRTIEWSRLIKAKHVLFLLDACASGLGFESKSGYSNLDETLLNTLSGNGSRFVITAGTARERAFQLEKSSHEGYSVFTHSFIEALRNNNQAYAAKGFLVLDEVFAETKVGVGRFSSEYGQRMTPRLWSIPRDDNDTGSFIFLDKNAKGASLSTEARRQFGLTPKNASSDAPSAAEEVSRRRNDSIVVSQSCPAGTTRITTSYGSYCGSPPPVSKPQEDKSREPCPAGTTKTTTSYGSYCADNPVPGRVPN